MSWYFGLVAPVYVSDGHFLIPSLLSQVQVLKRFPGDRSRGPNQGLEGGRQRSHGVVLLMAPYVVLRDKRFLPTYGKCVRARQQWSDPTLLSVDPELVVCLGLESVVFLALTPTHVEAALSPEV